ncbi:MAG: hypothetical protein EOP84_15295 [Verrucomicrobiaceae bacterium]|nr:MAG: hypothetical protein EOP84_15295 [Verrucomicrobiaceae bacterium]
MLTNFSLSTRPAEGAVTLYTSDEPAPPGDKAWTQVVREVSLEKLNEQKLNKPFSRVAKYLLIETNIADPGPVYSLFLYGDKPAVAYNLQKREQTLDSRAVFGPYVNESTALNVAGLYTKSVVSNSTSGDDFVSWQKAVDDNPESGLTFSPSSEQPAATVRYQEPRTVSRLALLADAGAKGTFDFYLVSGEDAGENGTAAATLKDRIPTVTMTLDGTTGRKAIDFPAVEATEMLVRWTPANGTDSVNVRELNAFAGPTLSTYAVNMTPEAIAELGTERIADSSKDGKTFMEGKSLVEGKEAVDALPPIGQLLPQSSPYLPGSLGFPPNLTTVRPPSSPPRTPPQTPPQEPPIEPPVLPPEEPVSP